MPRELVTPEKFVRVWQEANSLDEVVEKTGLTKHQASARATHYRSKGVPLKHFKKPKMDWGALKKLAKEVEEEK